MSLKKGEIFENSFEGVQGFTVSVSYADVTVTTSGTDAVAVKYTAGGGSRDVTMDNEGGILRITEKAKPFMFSTTPSLLEISVPDKEYEGFEIKSAAGKSEISGLICKKFCAELASGQGSYDLFANEIKLKCASGKTTLSNSTQNKADLLELETASGSHSVSGFGAERFRIKSASGKVNAAGVSGKGEISVSSGTVALSYAEWDDDLTIDMQSGKTELSLPEGSGVELELSALSGGVTSTLGGSESKLSGKCQCTIGSGNVHALKAHLMSGSVKIS